MNYRVLSRFIRQRQSAPKMLSNCCLTRGLKMPVGRKLLTTKAVENLDKRAPRPTGKGNGRKFFMDEAVRGFGVKVTEAGSLSYVLIKRYPGSNNPAPRQLGMCNAMSLDEAREKARSWLKLIAQGIDPAEQEREAELAAARRRENSFASVFEDFVKEKLAGERQGRDVARDMAKEFLTVWAKRPVADITTEDVLAIIRPIKQRAPSQARNLFGYVRRFFDWAIEERAYGIKVNPCAGLKPARLIGEKKSRDRVLTDEELFAFWRASGHTGYPFGPLYRMLLLTGLRLNEVADASWAEIDMRGGVWIIPSSRMKSGTDHVVPLTPEISAILNSLPRFKSGNFIFSTTFGKSPVWVSDKAKRRLDAKMLLTLRALARRRGEDPSKVELKAWRNHDLRRSLRTGLSKLRVDFDIREAVLGHARQGVVGVYDRHDFQVEKADALQRWAAYVQNLATPAVEANNVIKLHA
jgi:integrase